MKRRVYFLANLFAAMACPTGLYAINLDKATVTEVVNNVTVIERSTKKSSPAHVKQLFAAPNVLRTGADSRAELIAEDQTVTRVGQNTLFSFQPGSRDINLEQGSVLFQSPTGKGGGTIRTPAASAAVLGTTLIVTATKNGGFKVLLVEGKGRVKSANGAVRNLKFGQMVYALPGGALSNVFTFRLSQQVNASGLIGGFKKKLASKDKISEAVDKQEQAIESGDLIQTNYLASDSSEYAYNVDVDVTQDVLEEEEVEEAVETVLNPLLTAINTDVTISSPELDPAFIFTFDGENPPFADAPLVIGDEPKDSFDVGGNHHQTQASDAALFIARNTTFATPSVDLSSYEGRSLFQFFSLENTNFEGSLRFEGLSTTELQLVAGGTFTATPGTEISVDTSHVALLSLGSSERSTSAPPDGSSSSSPNGQSEPSEPPSLDSPRVKELAFSEGNVPLTLTDFSFENTGGGLDILAGEAILTEIKLAAKTDASVTTARDLTISPGSGFSIPTTGPVTAPKGSNTIKTGRSIYVQAGRDMDVTGLAAQADQKIRMRAGRNMKITGAILTSDISAKPGASFPSSGKPFNANVHLSAAGDMDLKAVVFRASDVMLQAKTINLTNVNFTPGRIILESALGKVANYNPTSGLDPSIYDTSVSGDLSNNGTKPSKPGFVNFIDKVKYGTADAQNHVFSSSAGAGRTNGIIIQKLK